MVQVAVWSGLQDSNIRYCTPQDGLRFGASLTGAAPPPRTNHPSELKNVLKHDQLPRSRPCLGGFNLARVALRPDQDQRVSGNATLTLIPTQVVRSGPANVPRPVPKCGRFPGSASGGNIARRADATSIPPIHSTCVYPAKDLP